MNIMNYLEQVLLMVKNYNRTAVAFFKKNFYDNLSKKKKDQIVESAIEKGISKIKDKVASTLGKMIDSNSIDCLTSLGGFIAGVIELEFDGDLSDKTIRFNVDFRWR